jgi:DNA-binding LacI/PurR family transcriptional regulator
MATVHDVARLAQVSITTVSRVMNGDATVHPHLRRAVEAAVVEIGYRPNAAARGLRRSRSGTIGVVMSGLMNPSSVAALTGIEAVAAEHGRGLFVCDAHGSREAQAAHLARLHEHRVEGLIVWYRPGSEELLAPLTRDGTAVVLLGRRRADGSFPEVVVDEDDAVLEAARLLLGLGHRRVGLIGVGYSDRRRAELLSSQEGRFALYRQAHEEAGVAVDRRLIAGGEEWEGMRAGTARLLSLPERPSALLVGSQAHMSAALLAVREAGLQIPRDLSVIALSDSHWLEAYAPPITAIRADDIARGRRAAELLFAVSAGTADVVVLAERATLVQRSSCAPPP